MILQWRASFRATRGAAGAGSAAPLLLPALAVLLGAGCAGAGAPGAPESVWRSYLEPRPEPLPGAARVSVGAFQLVPDGRWAAGTAVGASEGLRELVGTELLRRRDVHFVERRRFARAAERERRAVPRPDDVPSVGRSPGAELILFGSWLPAGPDSSALGLRITGAESGVVLGSWRIPTPREADPVSLARAAAGSLLAVLDSLGRRPAWTDPLEARGPAAAPRTYRDAGIAAAAIEAYFRGVDHEDRYEWEGALRAYRTALDLGGPRFFEPRVALSRAARLRAGGTLGSNP